MTDYTKYFEVGDKLLGRLFDVNSPDLIKRQAITNTIKDILYPAGNCDPELEKISEVYISQGIEALR